MLGAIYIGLSGMNAFSRGLQTISNNVANLNSPGYKASSVSFSDVFNVGGLGSSFSGRNNAFHGAGVRFGRQAVDFTQGDMRQSGGDLDLAIQGAGFLVLSNDRQTYYARTGQFALDDEGYISLLGSNYRLNLLDENGGVSPINLGDRRMDPPSTTRSITFSGNVSSSAEQAVVSDIAVFDALGTRHVWKVTFAPSTEEPVTPGKWTVTVTDETGAEVGEVQTLRFNLAGQPEAPSVLTFAYEGEGGELIEVTMDFSEVDSFSSGSTSTIRAAEVDGHGLGTLTGVAVTGDGRVRLTYSNARTVELGHVALASFRDPQQLERLGDGLFRNNGGPAALYASEAPGMGTLVSRQLEASNVDLAQQFGDLILIQRGFQASSQVVSVSNDMIQQLFGIRGQG